MTSLSVTRLPATSLIICSRNRSKLLAELVASILEGDEVPTELIIIDDSDSRHEELATLTASRTCELRYLWARSRGLSRANNTGIVVARHDVLVFAQDDVLVTPTWFGTIVRALVEAGPGSVVTGQVLPGEAEVSGGFAPATRTDEHPIVYEGRTSQDVLYVQNMAMYRSAVEKVGRFDERLGPGTPFPAAEDSDFALRLLETGYRILYVPQAVVYHRAWRTDADYLPLRWNYGVARGAFYAKHVRLGNSYMLQRMLTDIRVHVADIPWKVRHDRQRACGNAVLVFGILFGAFKWSLTQHRRTG